MVHTASHRAITWGWQGGLQERRASPAAAARRDGRDLPPWLYDLFTGAGHGVHYVGAAPRHACIVYAAWGLTAAAAVKAVAAAGPALRRARSVLEGGPRASAVTTPPGPPESTLGQSRWRGGRQPFACVSAAAARTAAKSGEGSRGWGNLSDASTSIYGDVDQTVTGAPRRRGLAAGRMAHIRTTTACRAWSVAPHGNPGQLIRCHHLLAKRQKD